MALFDTSQEKTLPPSRKRLNEARKQGLKPYSRDLTGWALLLALAIYGTLQANEWAQKLQAFLAEHLQMGSAITLEGMKKLIDTHIFFMFSLLSPFFLIVMVVLPLVFFFQTKEGISSSNGFSKRKVHGYYASMLVFKFLVFIGLAFGFLLVAQAPWTLQGVLLWMQLLLGGYLLIAGMDWMFERWRFYRSLWMSRSEAQEELREIRKKGIEFKSYTQNLQFALEKGSVVILASTKKIACILSFDPVALLPPICLYVSTGAEMTDVVRKAKWGGLSLIEKSQLAENLAKSVSQKGAIPRELYDEVAKVLASHFG